MTVIAPFDLAAYDTCVFDLDGTVWLGATDPIPGAAEFLQRCRDHGVRVAYATNAVTHSPAHLSERLVSAGLAAPDEPVITTGLVIARTLAAGGVTRVAGVLPEVLAAAIDDAGIEVVSPNDVDVADFGDVDATRALVMASYRGATIGAIERLGRLAVAGHRLYLSSTEPGFPVIGGIEPGGGALFAALSAIYDVTPIVLGKPSREYAAVVAETAGGPTARIAMIGDSQRADVGIAHLLGCDGVLLTGHSIKGIDPTMPMPTYVAPSLADEILAYEGVVGAGS